MNAAFVTGAAAGIVKAVAEGRKLLIDFDMAMNMTLPGIMSKGSIARGGEWITIPRLGEE